MSDHLLLYCLLAVGYSGRRNEEPPGASPGAIKENVGNEVTRKKVTEEKSQNYLGKHVTEEKSQNYQLTVKFPWWVWCSNWHLVAVLQLASCHPDLLCTDFSTAPASEYSVAGLTRFTGRMPTASWHRIIVLTVASSRIFFCDFLSVTFFCDCFSCDFFFYRLPSKIPPFSAWSRNIALHNMFCLLQGLLIYSFLPSRFRPISCSPKPLKTKTAKCLELLTYFDLWFRWIVFRPDITETVDWELKTNHPPTYHHQLDTYYTGFSFPFHCRRFWVFIHVLLCVIICYCLGCCRVGEFSL